MNFTKDQCVVIDNAKALVMIGTSSSNNCHLWNPDNVLQVFHHSQQDEVGIWHKCPDT